MRRFLMIFLISLSLNGVAQSAGMVERPTPQSNQTDEQRAYQSFKQAREAYEAGQWQKTIDLLEETIELLGETKLRIQPMLVNSLIKLQDWHNAKTQLNIYFNLQPDPQFVETQQMRATEREVTAKIAAEEREFTAAKTNPSQSAFSNYLSNWPHGKYRQEAQRLLANQQDEDAWAIARQKNNTAAYYAYLDKYPDGNHASYARATVAQWDEAAYEEAKEKGTQESYQYYLDNYPQGEYRKEISSLLRNKEDDDLYAYAKQTSTIEAYENYVRQYPNGNNAWAANQIIQNSYYNWGVDDYKAKSFYGARKNFQTLDSRYPTGKYNKEVDKYLRKVDRKISMRSAGFMMYTYDSISNYGFSFGRLVPHKAGYYVNLRGNPEIFTGFDVLYSIDEEGNNDSPWEEDIRYTGNRREANINLSIGVTFNLLYPLWGYIGGGAGYYPVYQEYDAYNRTWSGDLVFAETEYFRLQRETEWRFFPEAGVLFKVFDAIILKYGVLYNNSQLYHQFGAGFKVGS